MGGSRNKLSKVNNTFKGDDELNKLSETTKIKEICTLGLEWKSNINQKLGNESHE